MSKLIDLIGQQFGSLVVIERAENTSAGKAKWSCQCKCGNRIVIAGCYLRKGTQTDCGKHNTAWNFEDLTGKKFGRLTVLNRAENYKEQQARWKCLCDCGNEVTVGAAALKKGATKSCGCYKKEMAKVHSRTHGMSKSRLWRIWNNMHIRCEYPSSSQYSYYGGRGISVCQAWIRFEEFMEWALSNGYSDSLTIDRINVNGNYEPSNCRWATVAEQQRNKNSNHFVEFNGETKTLSEWSRVYGIDARLIGRRLKDGWEINKALFAPARKRAVSNDAENNTQPEQQFD